jgi:hypothetical protein
MIVLHVKALSLTIFASHSENLSLPSKPCDKLVVLSNCDAV